MGSAGTPHFVMADNLPKNVEPKLDLGNMEPNKTRYGKCEYTCLRKWNRKNCKSLFKKCYSMEKQVLEHFLNGDLQFSCSIFIILHFHILFYLAPSMSSFWLNIFGINHYKWGVPVTISCQKMSLVPELGDIFTPIIPIFRTAPLYA